MTTGAASLGRAALPAIGRAPLLVAWLVGIALLALAFAGQAVLVHDNDSPLFRTINGVREWIELNRNTNLVLVATVTSLRLAINALYEGLNAGLHAIGWFGMATIGAVLGWVTGGWRLALLLVTGFLLFGVLGLWAHSIDTLALTLTAVLLSLLVGIPLGIAAGRSDRVLRILSPILDAMQIMPSFAYLAPFTLFFLISPANAIIVTLIFAAPPVIRITALGIRGTAPATVEAATALGATNRQLLRKVQLPMARRTIILGINQTMMMALSMVVITALVNAAGLGKDIIAALQQNDVGQGFDAGLAIVIMAIMLDRLTTRASERFDPARGGRAAGFELAGRALAGRTVLLGSVGLIVASIALGHLVLGGDTFPDTVRFSLRNPVNDLVDWLASNLFGLTKGIKDAVSFGFINPLEAALTKSPAWVIGLAFTGVAAIIGGWRAAIVTAVALGVILALQMWEHSMLSLTQVLVATALTLLFGLAFGIVSARSRRFSMAIRPVLDFAQTMPAFVYLLPAVALFQATRFTAIAAAVIYAIPPVIRIVEVGIRSVPAPAMEAAASLGATSFQRLLKVELPLAMPALLVAANQGIILVLSMVVVGGLVGGGALGYDVVAGVSRRDFFGEGFAAALAIVALGIMLDRITQAAGARRRSTLDRGGRATAAA